MNLAATIALLGYGTSEGVRKEWESRGRGITDPDETFNTEGWLTKDGKFHPNMPGSGHQQGAEKLGFGDISKFRHATAVMEALRSGNVRIVSPKKGQVYFHADTDDTATRSLIADAIEKAKGLDTVDVQFNNDKKGTRSFFEIPASMAVTYLRNRTVPNSVAQWHTTGVAAGGPGSGRHPEYGQFKKIREGQTHAPERREIRFESPGTVLSVQHGSKVTRVQEFKKMLGDDIQTVNIEKYPAHLGNEMLHKKYGVGLDG